MVAFATPVLGRSGTPSGVRGTGALSRGRGSDARATIFDRSAVGELLRASYAYDPFKGVKTSSTWKQNVGGNWWTERSETYGYAADIEWLATVTSGGSSRTWDYDAAGNRISDTAAAGAWTYDALNRMTASPNLTYTNDILGNRLTRSGGTTSYSWDLVNRMSSFTSGGVTRTYEYRADGMRMKKILASSSVEYFYDGQMPIEERITAGTTVTSVQNAIGARGIDLITKSVVVNNGSPTVTKAYPIYDGHGNMVGTVNSSGTLADRRLYGPWGNVLSGSSTGLPNERFGANLGHLQDDESGLTYMRARYYEMGTGRFISEDPGRDGSNWFIYAANSPVSNVDSTGRSTESLIGLCISIICIITGTMLMNSMLSTTADIATLSRNLRTMWNVTYVTGLNSTVLKQYLQYTINTINQYDFLIKKRNTISGALAGTATTALIGLALLYKGLIIDIDLAVEGLGGLDMIYGN